MNSVMKQVAGDKCVSLKAFPNIYFFYITVDEHVLFS